MKPIVSVLLAAAAAAALMAGYTAHRKPIERPPVSHGERLPGNLSQVQFNWNANEVVFPDPLFVDGTHWYLGSSNGKPDHWESKRVNARKDGRLYATFPSDSRELQVWVVGGPRPTYASASFRP